MAAEFVMNCPDLRNLILSHRTDLMRPYEREYIKRKMGLSLNFIKAMIVDNIDEYDCTTIYFARENKIRFYKKVSDSNGHELCLIKYLDTRHNINYDTGFLR